MKASKTMSAFRLMGKLIVTVIVCTASVWAAYAQADKTVSTTLSYHAVSEFGFDERVQNYVPGKTITYSGTIRISSEKISIEGYNDKPDKEFKVIESGKEEGTNRDMYICEMKGETYALTLSPDKRYLTQIGLQDKFIYELKTQPE